MIPFRSTRGAEPVPLSRALEDGIAKDGGLYVPAQFPQHLPSAFPEASGEGAFAAVAEHLLAPFFAGDVLSPDLAAITSRAFDFPVPLVEVPGAPGKLSILELFHGPTAAFKDFGARFLATCMGALAAHRGASDGRKLTILVATSGDTGGAVAAAFHGVPWAEVVVLYPKGLVSPRQEQQLTCWDGNVRAFSVRGTFDDCQRMVKAAFADPELSGAFALSSANSINVGRLLPQAAYYAKASLEVQRAHGAKASFVVPSGNLGNVVACLWARRMGLPIDRVVLAHNENRTVPDFLHTGQFEARPSVATLASAMDVGNPSNLERLRVLYPDIEELRAAVRAVSVSDEAIRARIRQDHARYRTIHCPHTAVGAEAYANLAPAEQASGPWVLVSTAHPAKFHEIVEPLVGEPVPVPSALARLLALPQRKTEIAPELGALRAAMRVGP